MSLELRNKIADAHLQGDLKAFPDLPVCLEELCYIIEKHKGTLHIRGIIQ